MLQAQVNYWQLQETKQHNRATEEQAANELIETNRHNLATEKQQARQATAALRQAAAAAKNANTNLFVARYNRDLGYKNLAVNQQNADSNAKQAQAALKNAESNALQASAAWKNALTNAYAASAHARYQQGMLDVSQFNAQLSSDRNRWERDAQSIRNMSERIKQANTRSQTMLNWQSAQESQSRTALNKSNIQANTYLNELRMAQRDLSIAESGLAEARTYSEPIRSANDSVRSIASFIDAFLPF